MSNENENEINTNKVCYILDVLYECEALAKQLDEPAPIEGSRVLASYKNMEGDLEFAIECDMSLAASLGAALTRIPAGAARDAAASCEIPENIGDNLYEVLNICSTLFADYDGERILLDKVYLPSQELSETFAEKLESTECLMQMNYQLERYDEGKMSFLKLV